MMTKPKIIARDTAAEPPEWPTEIWCRSCDDVAGESYVTVCARNARVHNGVLWYLLHIKPNGVHFAKNIPLDLGLPLDAEGRLKVAE